MNFSCIASFRSFSIYFLFCITSVSLGCHTAGNMATEQQLLTDGWQFSPADSTDWLPASVPGTVHTDLMANGRIPDPYFGTNEADLQWIDRRNWVYKTSFSAGPALQSQQHLDLVFDGLDTYADVYLNDSLVLQADNMFHPWRINVKERLKDNNELRIVFHAARNKVDSIAKAALPLVIPDNPRVYVRKAQYHFGWDWGPTFATCGIWQKAYLQAYNELPEELPAASSPKVELVQEPDSIGKSFYFKIDGKSVYMKGANYIPSDMFVTRLTKDDYRKILVPAKEANMNMLRVWGGGIYENDAFYELCDSLGIYVWQDFMFAGGMVPTDDNFLQNVKQEVIYQVKRLRKYKSIVVWCGNNEVDEAWNNWGWQKQFNLHGEDSAKVWQAYARLFRDSIPAWVKQYDGNRPYVSTSPMHGWGRAQSMQEGDSHYWGVWWGLQDFEIFRQKTGRFVSEYGMQAMPNMWTINSFTQPTDRYLFSPPLKTHQKHPTGYQNIQSYLHRYFLDSNRVKKLSLENYTYLSQCLQYYAFKNIIAIHRSKSPLNMGTLLWQLNDCWPVASWAISDYSRHPKAAWYGVKQAYRDDILPKEDSLRPIELHLEEPHFSVEKLDTNSLSISCNTLAKYVYLSLNGEFLDADDNYFDLQAGEKRVIKLRNPPAGWKEQLKILSLYEVVK